MTRNVHIYDSGPDLNLELNGEVALCSAESIELAITMARFLFNLIVAKLNNLKAMSLNFFNGKIQVMPKSSLMLKKIYIEKEIIISKALVKC